MARDLRMGPVLWVHLLALATALLILSPMVRSGEMKPAPPEYQGEALSDGFGAEKTPSPTASPPDSPPDSPTPVPPLSLSATIEVYPSPPKPGEQVSLSATVTGPDGKTLTGAHKIWDVGKSAWGNVDPNFTWDGKELPIKLTVVYENNEYKFTKTIPAHVEETPAPEQPPTATPAASETKESATPPESGGSPWGPAAILGAVVVAVAGVIGVAGALIGRLRRPPMPRVPRPPVRRPPPPPPPPPPPGVPLPPPPPGPPTAPAGTTRDKPPDPEDEAPEDEEPEDEVPEDEVPEDEEPAAPPAGAVFTPTPFNEADVRAGFGLRYRVHNGEWLTRVIKRRGSNADWVS